MSFICESAWREPLSIEISLMALAEEVRRECRGMESQPLPPLLDNLLRKLDDQDARTSIEAA